MLASGIAMALVSSAISGAEILSQLGVILGVLRLCSLLVFMRSKDYQKILRKEKVSSYKEPFRQRSFILYFLPWVMFSLVNYLAVPLQLSSEYTELEKIVVIVQNVCMAAAAISGGVFVDFIGRKRVAIAAFAMFGLGSATIGFLGNSPPVLCLSAVIDGIAWGLLLGLFILTLWGDLSNNKTSEVYYALGVMPFFASKLLEETIGPMINGIETYNVFSFTALFMFLAVLPLFYAPETLPEKVMKEQELKFYVEQAQKVSQKYY